MTTHYALLAGLAALALSACGGQEAVTETAPVETSTPAEVLEAAIGSPAATSILAEVSTDTYSLDASHASVVWSLSHNGLSRYMSRFTGLNASLNFNAEDPTASTLRVTIDPASVRTDHPTDTDWDGELANDEKFFNAGVHPEITFVSKGVTLTGQNTGLVVGDLTLLGVTRQITLDTQFNGVENFNLWGERDVLGFSATATLKRSNFGMTGLLPNIGDEVMVTIEAEFLQDE